MPFPVPEGLRRNPARAGEAGRRKKPARRATGSSTRSTFEGISSGGGRNMPAMAFEINYREHY